MRSTHVGTAGWTIQKDVAAEFAAEGSHLEKYASRLNAVEINSSFYRHHQAKTYARWGETVPADFRYSVKLFRGLTHDLRLKAGLDEIEPVLEPVRALGERWGVLLVQLPPSLALEVKTARSFFRSLRKAHDGAIAFEPRHASWAETAANDILGENEIARVQASPAKGAGAPTVARGLFYQRLHGEPVVYRSPYSSDDLARYATDAAAARPKVRDHWVIFDNTAHGHALPNALEMRTLLAKSRA